MGSFSNRGVSREIMEGKEKRTQRSKKERMNIKQKLAHSTPKIIIITLNVTGLKYQ